MIELIATVGPFIARFVKDFAKSGREKGPNTRTGTIARWGLDLHQL
jgi:hypothetical protein